MSEVVRHALLEGLVIPACPLALDQSGQWSEQYQTALVRYYVESGAGGVAVGVHSTQFAIRAPEHGLFQPVLTRAAEEIDALTEESEKGVVKIAGICGDTRQAVAESTFARSIDYQAGLLSMTAVAGESDDRVLAHCRSVAKEIPIIGFYLQPAVGGRVFPYEFWREFAEIPEVVAIKIAPFNRYQTWDVVRAVIESGREDIALYTGNDDNILLDLLTPFTYRAEGKEVRRFINGGLLGQWGVWTKRAVQALENVKEEREKIDLSVSWLEQNVVLTDANAVIFDAANQFAGCIPGIMEVLRRQGLLPSTRCLNPEEALSPGQSEELDRIARVYPHLHDNAFVEENLDRWLR